jgi:L-alanine-DL-glutamate epimerase-like enolase superfamily enzyme
MRATARLERWPLAQPFGISRGVSTESFVLHVTIEHDGSRGHGEAEAAEFTLNDAERRVHECQKYCDTLVAADCESARRELQSALPAGAIRNAIDCALWDLAAKLSGRRAWELAGIAPRPIHTLYTIALDSVETMRQAAHAHRDWPWLKVKLGGGIEDSERLAAVHAAAPRAKLLVDANGGWSRAELERYAAEFAGSGVGVIEQPLPPGIDRALADWDGPIPLCADESCTDRQSLAKLPRGYRMINIKLDKTGGLTEALQLATAARAQGLGIMIGCNLGTSLAIAPGLLIAAGADVVDLDGPLLLGADRESPLRYDVNLVNWPERALWG